MPLSENKRFLIERELQFLKSGEQGEKDSAYYIDFIYSASKNWAVIHDLRLEFDGKVAQIDHLMINRLFDMYVLETKNYSDGLKITSTGEFQITCNNKRCAIESPIEQNNRHIYLLEKIIKAREIMPVRFGIPIPPTFKSFILISPKSRVIRPDPESFDTSMVIKADTIETSILNNLNKRSVLAIYAVGTKMVTTDTLMTVARKIKMLHKPGRTDYKKKFGIEEQPKADDKSKEQKKAYFCFKCKKGITEKVAKFCWDYPKRFGRKAFCFDCQKEF